MQKFLITAWSVRDGAGSGAAAIFAPGGDAAAPEPRLPDGTAEARDGSDIGGTVIRSV
jgi:hypothetical protein